MDRLIQVGINRLEKVESVESYIEARPKAFTQKNIHAGWHHSGLAPTNRYKHILRLGTDDFNSEPSLPLKPKPLATTFEDLIRNADDTALDSLNSQLSELAIRNEITIPIWRKIPKVLALNRQLLAEHIILKRRFRDIEKIVCE